MAGRLRLRSLGLYAIGAVSVPLLLWAVYQGLTSGLRSDFTEQGVSYETVAVQRGDLAEQVVGTGATKPARLVVVQSEIPGVVSVVHVDDGDRVEREDILVELDRKRLEHEVEELRAGYEMAQARARYELIGKAKSDVEQAQREYERVVRLSNQNVASPARLEEMKHALDVARLGVADARAEAAVREAGVAKAKAALNRVEEDLAKSVIRAALAGVVVRREVEVGSAVTDLEHGGTVVVVLADDSSIHVLAQVDENDIARVRTGQIADVRIDAFPDENFRGEVRKVSWSGSGDRNLANFGVEIELSPDARFRVGMSADVRITVNEYQDALLIPNNSIVRAEDGPAVRLVAANGKSFELVNIRTRYSNGFQTVVDQPEFSEMDHVLVLRATP